jgi:hypothetical protein
MAAAHLAAQLRPAPASFDVFLSMGSAHPLSNGLLASMTLPLGMPMDLPEGVRAFRALRRHRLQSLGERLFGRYPAAFDDAGPGSPGRGAAIRLWVGLDRPWIAHALRVVSYVRPLFSEHAWLALAPKVRPLVGLVSTVGRPAGGMRIEALDAEGNPLASVEYFAARNGLTVPALPPVWAACALLGRARPGCYSLRELITFEETVLSLRAHGCEVIVAAGKEPLLAPPP